MKIKIKCISIFVVLMLVLTQFAPCASAVSGNSGEEFVVDNSEQAEQIDNLFSQRSSLEHDYESNRAQIEEIDRQLMSLGVEFLDTEEASDLLSEDGVAPAWLPESTGSVRRTSRKIVVSYHGRPFDMQVLEGVPISDKSPLVKDKAMVSYKADGITAGVTKVILSVIGGATAEYIGGNLGIGLTMLDLIRDSSNTLQDSVSTSTVFNNVQGTALISLTAHMKYVYVKPYETPDAKYQGLYYFGNSVSCKITTVTAVHSLVDGEIVTDHDIAAEVTSTIQSTYYDDLSRAAEAYCDYNYNYNAAFQQDYTNYTMKLTIFNSTKWYDLPWVSHPNIIEE